MTDNLADTLKRNGLAPSTEDAKNLANNISVPTNTSANISARAKTRKGDNMDTLSKEQIIDVLQQFADKMSEEFNKLEKRVDDLASEIKSGAIKTQTAQESMEEIKEHEMHNDLETANDNHMADEMQQEPMVNTEMDTNRPINEQMVQDTESANTNSPKATTSEDVAKPEEPSKPKNPQDEMVDSVDLANHFNFSK